MRSFFEENAMILASILILNILFETGHLGSDLKNQFYLNRLALARG